MEQNYVPVTLRWAVCDVIKCQKCVKKQFVLSPGGTSVSQLPDVQGGPKITLQQ